MDQYSQGSQTKPHQNRFSLQRYFSTVPITGEVPPALQCEKEKMMDGLDKYNKKRKKEDTTFAENFDKGYKDFAIGALPKMARDESQG